MSVFAFHPTLAPYARDITLTADGTLLRAHVYDSALVDADAARKPVALLVHGLNDDADTWRHVFVPLARDFRVIAPDLPGFGRSYKPARPYTIAFFRETLLALMDALEVPVATLIGNSMGAMICQALSLDAPTRVQRLILVCGALILRQQPLTWDMVRRALPVFQRKVEDKSASFRRDPQAAYALLRPYYADFDALSAQDQHFLLDRVRDRVWDDAQFEAYRSVWQHLPVWFLFNRAELRAQIAASRVDTHVAWGEADTIFSVEHAEAQIEVNPAIHLVMIPAAGHLPQQEQPEAFLRAIGFERLAHDLGDPGPLGDA